MTQSKQKLRQTFRTSRRGRVIPSDEAASVRHAFIQLCKQLDLGKKQSSKAHSLPCTTSALTVASFLPIGGELDVSAIHGIRTLVPGSTERICWVEVNNEAQYMPVPESDDLVLPHSGITANLTAEVPSTQEGDFQRPSTAFVSSVMSQQSSWQRNPETTVLPPSALTDADIVIVPCVAVDHQGTRLGQGGGWYDQALTHIRSGVPIVGAVLDEAFVSSPLPREAHDIPLSAVITQSRTHIFEADSGQYVLQRS